MKALLDTHAFLWWILDDPRISSHARKVMGNGKNQLFLSAVSGWEIAIKAKLGRLQLPDHLEPFIEDQMVLNGVESLPVQMAHALYVYRLPSHHRDPFDRMLIAQAKLEGLPILTADAQIARYSIKTIW